MRIDIVTVFPEMVEAALDHSIVKRARERGLITIQVVGLRDFTVDRHRTTDDVPYGGGGGMVMKVEPIYRALEHLKALPQTASVSQPHSVEGEPEETAGGATPRSEGGRATRVVITDPRGPRFTQETARAWAREDHIVILCGHYEGMDERVRRHLVTDEISIGDYILTGGELPALVVVDALTRLQPGALGDEEAPNKDTFAEDLLEYPHYTRPRVFNDWAVPDILLCGHHAEIERWRRWWQLKDTRERRPDLFARLNLSAKDEKLLHLEEPVAPPDNKLLLRSDRMKLRSPEPQPVDTEEREETDGTGTGNDTTDRA